MQSSYEKRKELSNYHFDNTKYDPDVDKLTYLGNIATNYDSIIKNYIHNSKPITWETRGYKQENVEIPSQDLIEEVLDLEKNGYDKDTVISNMSWELDSTLKNIADKFGLENCMSRVHIQMPGQVWNLHLDKLEKFNPEVAKFDSVIYYLEKKEIVEAKSGKIVYDKRSMNYTFGAKERNEYVEQQSKIMLENIGSDYNSEYTINEQFLMRHNLL
jgi:hypothetical protein